MTTSTHERVSTEARPTRRYLVATDGACSGNPGPGGWGARLISYEDDKVRGTKDLSGSAPDTTNNRMELTAAIRALRFLENRTIPVTLTTDSRYVVDGMTKWIDGWRSKGWRTADGKKVKNADLWGELFALSEAREVIWEWVKGHSGHALNDAADRLATRSMRRMLTRFAA